MSDNILWQGVGFKKAHARILLLLVILLAGQRIGWAQTPPTLKLLIDSAIRKDFSLMNAQLDIEAIRIDQEKLKEIFLPRIELAGKDAFVLSAFDSQASEIRIPPFKINIEKPSNHYSATSNLVAADLSAKMLLYSGGKVPDLKKALTEKTNAREAMLEKSRQDMISQVAAAYDQLGLLKQVKLALTESEKRLSENKRTADKALTYGLITPYEHQKIELARLQLQSKMQEYEGKRALVLKQLEMLTGLQTEHLALIDPDLKPLVPAVSGTSIENRPEIKALDAAESAGRYKIKAEENSWKPKIQAFSSVGYIGLLGGQFNSRNPLIINPGTLSAALPNLNVFPNFSIGVGFKWDLFDGKEGRREVQKSKIELLKVQNERKEAIEKLELNLAKNQADYNIAQAQIAFKLKQKDLAQNALAQATKEYKVGLIKSAQLIEAENDYRNAALEYAQAVFTQRRAAIEVLKSTGSLKAEDLQ